MGINEKLLEIQVELRANKSQFNKFGNYSYRSLEDIYEAVKPLLAKTKTILTINDDLEVFNGVIFRKSTATLSDVEGTGFIQSHTYTQESLEKKGMSVEQCSGSVASYGNKYCLNKLFCIDDARDADTRDNKEERPAKKELKMTTEEKRNLLLAHTQLTDSTNKVKIDWIKSASDSNLTDAINKLKEKGELNEH